MARIEVATHIEVPPQRVWDVLVDWERQAEWMVDASRVEVRSDHREGVGVVLRCRTKIVGVAIDDDLAVTDWSPPSSLGVTHQGPVIRGVAAFELTPTEHGTHLLWWEEVQAPLGGAGEMAATVAVVPWVRRVFRRSLATLKRRCEAPASG